MDITNLNRDELLELKESIDKQIIELDKPVKLKGKLSKCNKIYCINFNGSKIYYKGYVDIHFYDPKDGYINYSTSHKTKPVGCSSSIREEYMDKTYFLNESCSSMYFFTLKPESWKRDLECEMNDHIKYKFEKFTEEIEKFKHNITSLIEGNE